MLTMLMTCDSCVCAPISHATLMTFDSCMSMLRTCDIRVCARAPYTSEDDIPEVAFAGRSNVGKSSLINAVTCGSAARSSDVPGREPHAYPSPTFQLTLSRLELEFCR